ncbi:uncharacterized protein [Atheta coriaria]
MKFVGITDQLPVILTSMSMGSEVILMFEFGKSMNMSGIICHDCKPTVPMFILGYLGRPTGASTYPVSNLDLSFLTPKSRSYINWLALLQVFEVKLWILIFSCYVLIGCYFWMENIINQNVNSPRFLSITGLFLLQGLNHRSISPNLRTRCLIATVLVIAVLVSSMFSSGVVQKMMTVSYEGEVLTIEQLADSELMVQWSNNPLNFFESNAFTEAEVRAFSRWSLTNFKLPYYEKAIAHYVTITRLSTSLSRHNLNILPFV